MSPSASSIDTLCCCYCCCCCVQSVWSAELSKKAIKCWSVLWPIIVFPWETESKQASCKSHMSTTLLCFKAIFLFELCNEAWTFEVAKMSSEKKVITQFIAWLSYFCKQAETFVKTLRGRRSWARNFSSTKCSPKCINSIKGCYTENLLRGLLLRKIGTGSFKTANCNLSKKRRFTITHSRLFFFLWT